MQIPLTIITFSVKRTFSTNKRTLFPSLYGVVDNERYSPYTQFGFRFDLFVYIRSGDHAGKITQTINNLPIHLMYLIISCFCTFPSSGIRLSHFLKLITYAKIIVRITPARIPIAHPPTFRRICCQRVSSFSTG